MCDPFTGHPTPGDKEGGIRSPTSTVPTRVPSDNRGLSRGFTDFVCKLLRLFLPLPSDS